MRRKPQVICDCGRMHDTDAVEALMIVTDLQDNELMTFRCPSTGNEKRSYIINRRNDCEVCGEKLTPDLLGVLMCAECDSKHANPHTNHTRDPH